jgi:hypothetical protein
MRFTPGWAVKILNAVGKVVNLADNQASLFVKDVSVGTTAVQIDTDTAYRDEVILLADKNNTADIKVGTSTSQLFPLSPGASVGIRKTSLNLIYAVAVSGTQTLHVIAGGS